MNILDFLTGSVFGKVLDKIFPDAGAKQQAQLAILQMNQAGEFKQLEADLALAKGQTDVNLVEANSPSLFKGGWRPFIGWICGLSLGYDFLTQPLLAWASTAYWHVPVPPQLDIGTLITLCAGMLGLSASRTTERINGVIPSGK